MILEKHLFVQLYEMFLFLLLDIHQSSNNCLKDFLRTCFTYENRVFNGRIFSCESPLEKDSVNQETSKGILSNGNNRFCQLPVF